MPSLKSLTALLIVLVACAWYEPYWILNTFAGRRANPASATGLLNHGSLNNDRCWKNSIGKACEDVRIHHDSGVAFLACGYPETRQYFFPPIGNHDKERASTYLEYFVKYDLKTNSTTRLRVEGLDPAQDLVLHGMDVVSSSNESMIYIFAVNHARDGESIVKFSHDLGTDTLRFEQEFKHSAIRTPNAVAAASPSSFFVSNDHYFYGGTLGGVPRHLEHKYGPFWWASNVVHCSTTDDFVNCKTVSPKWSLLAANGAVLVENGTKLLINDLLDASTTIYRVEPQSNMLTFMKKISHGSQVDNLSLVSGSEDVLVCAFPDIAKTWERLSQPLNTSLHVDAAIIRLGKGDEYRPKLLYWDDGSLLSVLTGAAFDDKRQTLVAGGAIEQHFIVCDISDA